MPVTEASDALTLPELLVQTSALKLSFFEMPALELACSLLGCVLLHGKTAGTIVETEAYLGGDDQAAHAAKGRTPRTEVLFGAAGRAYVYFIYGMHECLNVVAEGEGKPGCVLIRALAPICGIELMRKRRNWNGAVCGLTNGPGKLTQALAINRSHYGQALDQGDLSIRRPLVRELFAVQATPRIGISRCVDWPLRFVWKDHPCLSRR